jgi:hypothetical protein
VDGLFVQLELAHLVGAILALVADKGHRVLEAGLWIRIWIGSGFSDFVDPDPYWVSGSRIRIQGQES